MKTKYEWTYGENEHQIYYDTTVGNNYHIYMGAILSNQKNNPAPAPIIWDKTRNDEQRKKQGLPLGCDVSELHKQCVLCSNDPIYMMKKVEYCYEHNLQEISNKPYKSKDKSDIER